MKPLLVSTIVLVALLVWLTPVHAESFRHLCADLGSFTTTVVQKRDKGIPPTRILQIIAKNTPPSEDPAFYAFQEWIVLFVYDMSALDAAWLRQRVETKCLQQDSR